MTTKKEYSARALKAWRTRRKNSKAKGVPKAVLEIDEVALEKQNKLLKKCLKRKYSKKVRHLAAVKAWRTRRKNKKPDQLPVSDPVVQHSCKGASEFEASGKGSVKRHDAAVKAWKTRRKKAA